MIYCNTCDANHSDAACVDLDPRKAYDIADEDSTYRIAVFSRATVEAAYGPVEAQDVDTMIARLTGWHEYYCGPGRAFGHAPTLRVMKRNIIIRQFAGVDI